MDKLFATLIINKTRTFAQVPDDLKVAVATYLNKCGYNTNGDLIGK